MNSFFSFAEALQRDGELVSQGDEEYIPVDNCVLYAVWQADEIVAESEEEKEVGLSNCEELESDEAMLFIYEEPQHLDF